MVEKYTNVFYFNALGEIGGIETFIWEIAKKYNKWDIVCIYKVASPSQVSRLRKIIRTIRFTKKFDCEKLFISHYATDPSELLVNPVKTEVINIAHANYKVQEIPVNCSPYIDKYYAVSKWTAEAYQELLKEKGIDKEVKVLYNPIDTKDTPRLLKLISAQRMSSEKGLKDIVKLAEALNKAKIPFMWLVFTNGEIPNVPNLIKMEPRLDIRQYIKEADYLVLLSKTEGCPYNILEALDLGTACIVHPIPSLYEIGINEGNSYILPFDMENIPIEDIYNKIPAFTYKPPKDSYNELIIHKKSDYKNDGLIDVKAITTYEDIELKKTIVGGTIFQVDRIRADDLIDKKKVIEI